MTSLLRIRIKLKPRHFLINYQRKDIILTLVTPQNVILHKKRLSVFIYLSGFPPQNTLVRNRFKCIKKRRVKSSQKVKSKKTKGSSDVIKLL